MYTLIHCTLIINKIILFYLIQIQNPAQTQTSIINKMSFITTVHKKCLYQQIRVYSIKYIWVYKVKCLPQFYCRYSVSWSVILK